MKKLSLIMVALFAAAQIFAQGSTLTSKKGHVILPETGDYALGFDAVPVLDFALNMVNIMNNTGQTAQHPGFVSGFNNVIVGKYFVSGKLAYRARLGINSTCTSLKTYGNDPLDPANPNPENILLSTSKSNNRTVILGGGLEYRRGHNRLQGFYGGEAMLGFAQSTTKNKYEIEYNTEASTAGYIAQGSNRVLSNKTGTSVLFGVRGFVGVEYFVLPKISIAGEFGWGFGISTSPRGSVETEYWDIEPGSTATSAYQYTDVVDGNTGGMAYGFSVDDGIGGGFIPSASLSMLFHF
jgi:hypothetical protein